MSSLNCLVPAGRNNSLRAYTHITSGLRMLANCLPICQCCSASMGFMLALLVSYWCGSVLYSIRCWKFDFGATIRSDHFKPYINKHMFQWRGRCFLMLSLCHISYLQYVCVWACACFATHSVLYACLFDGFIKAFKK